MAESRQRITRDELADALQDMEIAVNIPAYDRLTGTVISGSEVADRVFRWLLLGREDDGDEPVAYDPEVSAIAAIVGEIGNIATGDTDQDERTVRRIVRYLCDRYGTDD